MATGGPRVRRLAGMLEAQIKGGSEMRVDTSTNRDIENSTEQVTAVALYDYQAEEDNELTFDPGDIITNIDKIDEGWWVGELQGKRGMFPANFVKVNMATGGLGAGELTRVFGTQHSDIGSSPGLPYHYDNKEGSELRLDDTAQPNRTHAERVSEKGDNIVKTIKLQHAAYRVWLSKDKSTIFVGGNRCGLISVVCESGDDVKRIDPPFENDVRAIVSGICLNDAKHLIIAAEIIGEESKGKVYFLELDEQRVLTMIELTTGTSRLVFNYSDANVGILRQENEKKQKTIEIWDKISMKKRKVVILETRQNDSGYVSAISRANNGEFIMSNHSQGVVNRYQKDGRFIESIGSKTDTPFGKNPGVLYRPRAVITLPDGGLHVACADGRLHKYKNGRWESVVLVGDWLTDGCFGTNGLWFVLGTELNHSNIFGEGDTCDQKEIKENPKDNISENGVRAAITVNVPHKGYRVWLSKDEKTVFIGGNKCGKLSVVADDGDDIHTINLPIGENVIGITNGMCLTDCKHFIISVHKAEDIILVKRFVLELKADSSLLSVSEYTKSKPSFVFKYDKKHIGMYHKGVNHMSWHIEIMDKQHLISKKVVCLVTPKLANKPIISSVCRAHNGGYLIGNSTKREVYIYHNDGNLIDIIGSKADDPFQAVPGKLNQIRAVFNTPDGGLLIACADGLLHKYKNGKWVKVVKLESLVDVVIGGSQIFSVWEATLIIHNITDK